MANNSTPSSLWTFPLPMMVPPPSNTNEQKQSSSIGHGIGERKQRTLRLSINARERRRMHDLNDALDELRSVVCLPPFRFFILSEDGLCFRFRTHIHRRYGNWVKSRRCIWVSAFLICTNGCLQRNLLRSAKNFILLQAQAIDELKKCVLRASLMSSQPGTIVSPTTAMDFHSNDRPNEG